MEENKKKNSKMGLLVFLLIVAIIIIAIMALYIYRLTEEKTVQSEIVSNLNGQIVNLETTIDSLQENLNILSNTIENNAENNSNEDSSTANDTKYEELTEAIYSQIPENKHFIIQSAEQTESGNILLKGRIYEDIELTSISKEEYDSLKATGEITLFGEKFSLGEYEDFVPGYILRNSNNYGFYVTDSYELVNFSDTSFVQGTDEYYTVTLDDTVKLKLPDDSEETINTTTLETIEDNNFINLGVMYDFEFDNGKLSKIIYMM